VDLKDLLQRLGFKNVKQSNKDWMQFSCPVAIYRPEHNFTEDSNPSSGATIAEDGNVYWNCFCCKSSGNLIKLVEYLETKSKKDYSTILEELESGVFYKSFDDYYVRKAEPSKDKEIPEFLWDKLFDGLDAEAAKYLSCRGISGKTAKKLGLRYNLIDKRIVFPYKVDDKIFGYASRTIIDSKPKILNHTFDIARYFLGQHLWTNKVTILVEGLFAYAKLHELGFSDEYDICALSGTKLSDNQLEILFKKDKTIILFLDGDNAGLAGAENCYKALHKELPTMKVEYPSGFTDIDYLTKEQINTMLQEASF
jgi:DNA primase